MLGLLCTYADGDTATLATLATATVPVVVDSGAWSVHTGTTRIDLDQHTAFVTAAAAEHPTARFIGLDVIGDTARTWTNWRQQRADGAPVEPTIHYGTDPAWATQYLHDLPTGWVNLGGLVKANPERAAAWAAAVRRALPPSVRVHGLGATHPTIHRLLALDAADSTYWRITLLRHRTIGLFDPDRGDWRTFGCATTNPEGRARSWADAHQHGRFLRTVYDISPSGLVDATDDTLVALSIASQARFATWVRDRHPSRAFTLYLAATENHHHQLIQGATA